ncbi:hypothetical protein [Streptomyces sp. NPDC001719]
MPQHRRPSAAAVLLLLLAVVLGPFLSGTGPFAATSGKGAAVSKVAEAARQTPLSAPGSEARPHAADSFGSGGTCKQQDAPLSGTQAVVPHAHTDPLTGPGAGRTTLPEGHAPRPGAPRAPPVPVGGCAELLPVLRI